MQYVQIFLNEMKSNYEITLNHITTYPSPLNELAKSYVIKSLDPDHIEHKNYISYLLPYWVNEISGLSSETCSKISLACSYGMLSFFIQDDLMDDPSSKTKEDIALAQLFSCEMNSLFSELFDPISPFWAYYRRYLLEWAQGTTTENQADYFITDPIRVARKASLVKLGSTAILLAANKANLIQTIDQIVDWTLVSLQMSDDWIDWEEDFETGSYNCLISWIQHSFHVDSPPTIKTIKNHIHIHYALEQYAEVAENNHLNASLLLPELKLLHAYHRDLTINLREISKMIKRRTESLLSGGFYYHLHNSTLS